jgi:hypothetical protein
MRRTALALLASVILMTVVWALPILASEQESDEIPKSLLGVKDLKVGGLWYLSYQDGKAGGADFSKFTIKRGYINIEKKIFKWGEDDKNYFSGRITPDTTQDDTGDVKVRLKYAYGKFNWKSASWEPWVEFGIVHMPWLDFEEHINLFRMQDTMFMERYGSFNSADFGVTFGGFFGPKLESDYLKYYPGRYGSFALGVYNGSGYHAKEKNEGKVIEGRITLRPAPEAIPGLQISYFGISGEGNVEAPDEPDWTVNAGMVSYEHPRFVLTGQYYAGDGNQKGDAVDENGDALARDGYSAFAEVRLDPEKRFSLIGRYDNFDYDDTVDDDEVKRTIVGVAWDMNHHNTFLLDYDKLTYADDREDDDRIQLTLQVSF